MINKPFVLQFYAKNQQLKVKKDTFVAMRVMWKILGFPIVVIVKIYQWVISPILPQSCRYTPTCSNYMLEAVHTWGPFKGFYLGVKRILSCHPWGGQGHDPVPKKNN